MNANTDQQGASSKLPYLDEAKDDMESYLIQFACFAKVQKIEHK